jgi:hypothetical protein
MNPPKDDEVVVEPFHGGKFKQEGRNHLACGSPHDRQANYTLDPSPAHFYIPIPLYTGLCLSRRRPVVCVWAAAAAGTPIGVSWP